MEDGERPSWQRFLNFRCCIQGCPPWFVPCCKKTHLVLCAASTYVAVVVGFTPMFVFFNYPRHVRDIIMPETLGIGMYEHVSYPSYDNLLSRNVDITAVYYPSQMPAGCPKRWLARRSIANTKSFVIAQHGLSAAALAEVGGSAVSRMAAEPMLCAGFNVLTPDLRNHGHSSDARPITAGYQEATDILIAAQWLVDHKNATRERLFLWGESLGAATVSYAAARDARFRALAIEAPPVSCGMVFGGFAGGWPYWIRTWFAWWHKTLSLEDPYNENLMREARFIAADVLHSHGYEDPIVPFANAQAFKMALEGRGTFLDAAGKPRRPSYASFFHHGDHSSSWKFADYSDLMLDFFSRAAASANDLQPLDNQTFAIHNKKAFEEMQASEAKGWMV